MLELALPRCFPRGFALFPSLLAGSSLPPLRRLPALIPARRWPSAGFLRAPPASVSTHIEQTPSIHHYFA